MLCLCVYLADVGALGLDADGVELELAERLPHPRVLLPLRRPLPQPRRLLHLRVPPGVRPRPRDGDRRRSLGAAPERTGPITAAGIRADRPGRQSQLPGERALHRGRRIGRRIGAALCSRGAVQVQAMGSKRRVRFLLFPVLPLSGSQTAGCLRRDQG
jgi:hypothetical protein